MVFNFFKEHPIALYQGDKNLMDSIFQSVSLLKKYSCKNITEKSKYHSEGNTFHAGIEFDTSEEKYRCILLYLFYSLNS